MEQDKTKFMDRFKRKYRLSVFDDDTLSEVSSFHLSKMNIFAYAGVFMFLTIIITALLFVYTPLNALLPSSTDAKLQRKIVDNTLSIDTIQYKISARDLYLIQLKNVLQGKIVSDTSSNKRSAVTDTIVDIKDMDFSPSELDSILRAQIEHDENKSLSVIDDTKVATSMKNLQFFMPVKGILTNKFDSEIGHLGIDIVAEADAPIMAALAGTVIMATWSLETGYVIQIQHDNNLVSFYKHNSILLKETGDRVEAGESIAIIGNSGEVTTGPHLHFELWNNGVPIDPELYISH